MNTSFPVSTARTEPHTVFGLVFSLIFLMSGVNEDRPPDKLMTARTIQARYGFLSSIETQNTITFKNKYTTMVFEADSQKLLMNDTLIWLNSPVVRKGKHWHLTRLDMEKIVDPLLNSRRALSSSRRSTIVLDPGHGGSDSGAVGRRRVYEKKVVLDLAKRVVKKLKNSGSKVELTRNGDDDVTLEKRSDKARDWKADVFVSIHINSAPNRNASGIESFVLSTPGCESTSGSNPDRQIYPGNKHDRASIILGYCLQKAIVSSAKAPDRGVKRARFEVLKEAPCPAALIECGFVSSHEEESKMIETAYRDKIADGIAQGILMYLSKIPGKP